MARPPVTVGQTKPDFATTSEDAIILNLNVLANDAAGLQTVTPAGEWKSSSGATITLNADGSLNYDPTGSVSLQALQVGESVTDTFTYTAVDKKGKTYTQTVFVSVSGQNDAPVVTSVDAGALTESAAPLSTSGFFRFSDVDTTDAHTQRQSFATAVWTRSDGSTEAFASDAFGTFTSALDQGSSRVGWDYTTSETAIDFLAAGETLTIAYTIEVTDSYGASTSQDVTITIAGANDAPVIDAAGSIVSGTTAELADGSSGENVEAYQLEGILLFADLDVTDEHTAILTPHGSGYVGSMVLGPINQAAGSIGWSFSVADDALEYLGQGQILEQTYDVLIQDGAGAIARQAITVTIEGANDAPVVQSEIFVTSLTEDTERVGIAAPIYFMLNGRADDVDSDDDASTLTYDFFNPSEIGGTFVEGMFPAYFDSDVNFLPGDDFQYLAEGQSVDVTIDYSATDRHGAVSNVGTLVFTIGGVNDNPTLMAGAAEAMEDGSAVEVDLSTLGDDIDSDDDGASLIYAVLGQPAEGSAWLTGNLLSFDPGAGFQDLAAGETRDVIIEVTATDRHGATAASTVTMTVTGVNDAPLLFGSIPAQTGFTDESFTLVLPEDLFVDHDGGGPITYSVTLEDGTALPTWLTFDDTTRTLSFAANAPGSADLGIYALRVTATEDDGQASSTTMVLSVLGGHRGDCG